MPRLSHSKSNLLFTEYYVVWVSEKLYVSFIGLAVFRRVRKLRRATACFVTSVRSHGTPRLPLDGFSWYLIFEYFRKSVEKIHVSLRYNKNKGYFTWTRHMRFSCWILRLQIHTENM
jgi:hypothetical protein